MKTNRLSAGRAATWGMAALLVLVLPLTACQKKQQGAGGEVKELVIGLQCDRTGPTQTVGPFICDAFHDYVKLFNKKQSLGPNYALRVMEIDHGYNVPRGVEAYERFKEAGAVTISIYGTPHTYSLTPKLTEDKILGTSPGFGNAAAADGNKFPFIFPIAATYWSQGASAVKFVMDHWKGPGKPKIAYLYYDNPAGREPLDVLRDLSKQIGFTMQEYAVPPPGIEMRPQVLDIARNFKADWVIAHLFGRSPGVSIKEFARVDFPRDRMVSLIWGTSESDINVAGWDEAEGYYGLQVAGVGQDFPVIKEIQKMYEEEGKPRPTSMDISVYYNRGVLFAALHARAIQLALEKNGYPITGEQVRDGMESIRDFDLGGFLPPLNISRADHEGGGWVKIYQVKGGKFVEVTDWIQGYREVVLKHVAEAKVEAGG
jgi:branched-chain amino acid transport system substrate-binding protein